MDAKTAKEFISDICNRTPPLSQSVLEMYLELVNAPPSLEGLIFVTEQFRHLFPYINKILKIEEINVFINETQLELSKSVADIIMKHKDVICCRYPETIKHSKKQNFLYGNYTRYPSYSCIGVSAYNTRRDKRHIILEVYILISTYILRRRQDKQFNKKGMLEFEETMVSGCRLARQLILHPKADTLNVIPNSLQKTAGEYLAKIIIAGDNLQRIAHLLRCALEGHSSPTYVRKSKRKEFRNIELPINDAVDPELEGRADKVSLLQSRIRQATKNLDPPESSSGVEYLNITSADKTTPMESRTSSQHAINKRYYLSSIAMHNQRLPMNWDQLSKYEVSIFLEAVQLLSENRYPLKFKSYFIPNGRYSIKLKQIEIAAAAVTVFLRSVGIYDITNIKMCSGKDNRFVSRGYRYYEDKPGCWVVMVPSFGLDTNLDNNFYSNAERKREQFFLSSGTGLERIIDIYIKEIGISRVWGNLFDKESWMYRKTLDEMLTQLNKQYKTRLTLKRIELYLHNTLTRQTGGDLTTAMLLTGRNDFLGTSPLHYTAIPVEKLQKLYNECCTEIVSGHANEMASRHPKIESSKLIGTKSLNAWGGMAGTPYRPRRRAVRKMISRLQDRMRQLNKMPRSVDKLIRVHNNIMRYTAILFAFCTGFRAVTSPLLPPSQIDEETGFAVISDKDGLDYYNARIVWLPPVCIKQYCLYIDHLEAFMPLLEHLDLEAFNALKIMFYQDRPEDKLPLFFLLDKHGDSTKITPTDLWKNIRENLRYNLPANASRHYLRSLFLEKGCPPEIIAAFMGHWERGEEPWGRFSALSPTNYSSTIAKHLVPILADDGWGPIAGIQEYW